MTTAFRKSVRDYYKLERAEGQRASQALLAAKHDARYGMVEDFYCRVITPIQRRKHRLMPNYAGEEVCYELPGGLHAIVKIEYDTDCGPPWKNSDGHGVVSDWEYRGEADGRWVLHHDRYDTRYYDWKETLKIAKRDGWSPHNGDLMGAVRRNYEYLRAWYNDTWYYVGLIVELYDANDRLISEESCWGYESYCEDYLCSEARSWLRWMLVNYRKQQREKRKQERIASRFRDAMECGV